MFETSSFMVRQARYNRRLVNWNLAGIWWPLPERNCDVNWNAQCWVDARIICLSQTGGWPVHQKRQTVPPSHRKWTRATLPRVSANPLWESLRLCGNRRSASYSLLCGSTSPAFVSSRLSFLEFPWPYMTRTCFMRNFLCGSRLMLRYISNTKKSFGITVTTITQWYAKFGWRAD